MGAEFLGVALLGAVFAGEAGGAVDVVAGVDADAGLAATLAGGLISLVFVVPAGQLFAKIFLPCASRHSTTCACAVLNVRKKLTALSWRKIAKDLNVNMAFQRKGNE